MKEGKENPETEKIVDFSTCFQGYKYCMDKEISYIHIDYPDVSRAYERMVFDYYGGEHIPAFRCFFSSSIKSIALKK